MSADRNAAVSGGIMCGERGCVPISAADADALWKIALHQKAERIARLPDEASAIRAMFDGHLRLMELGWREATYAPKGVPLELIEAGSTGIHSGHRDDIGFWIDDGDTWPTRAVLFRPAIAADA